MSRRRTFIELVETGTPQQIQAAIDQGEDVNAKDKLLGWTALMYAARFNKNPEVITTLLSAVPTIPRDQGCLPLLPIVTPRSLGISIGTLLRYPSYSPPPNSRASSTSSLRAKAYNIMNMKSVAINEYVPDMRRENPTCMSKNPRYCGCRTRA